MTTSDKSIFTSFLTGGDLVFHRLQLFFANIVRLSMVWGMTFAALFWSLVSVFATKYEWYVYWNTSLAKFWVLIHLGNYRIDFIKPDGEFIDNVTSAAIVKYVSETPELVAAFERVAWLGTLAFLIASGATATLIWYYIKHGAEAQTDEFLRGQKIVDADQLRKLIDGPSPLSIAGIFLPVKMLARNVLLLGSMGSGKSVVTFQLIEDARKWKKKLVIYDKTGEYTQKFFRPGVDILLNPVDARCADWSIFADLRKTTDAAMVSRFFVPENKKSSDPVWDNAARMLLEDVITIVHKSGGTMAEVREIITQYSLTDLHKLLSQNGASSVGVINPENSRGSESVRLTLTAQPAIRFFEFFDNQKSDFSIRDFVRREDDACLFLVSNSTQHEAVKPFVSAWIELALAEAMSMPPTNDIRLMFVLDELASLSKLKALDIAFTEARKYGIVSIVGIQNLSQLDDIYGEDMTKTFVANLQNKLILRTEEEASARRLADTIGKEEVDEVNESKSFGVESSRDGVSLSGKRTERHLVTPSEIMVLPDLTGYLKIAGAFPVAKVSFKYKERNTHVEAYIERDGLDLIKLAHAQPTPREQAVDVKEAGDEIEELFPAAPPAAEQTTEGGVF